MQSRQYWFHFLSIAPQTRYAFVFSPNDWTTFRAILLIWMLSSSLAAVATFIPGIKDVISVELLGMMTGIPAAVAMFFGALKLGTIEEIAKGEHPKDPLTAHIAVVATCTAFLRITMIYGSGMPEWLVLIGWGVSVLLAIEAIVLVTRFARAIRARE